MFETVERRDKHNFLRHKGSKHFQIVKEIVPHFFDDSPHFRFKLKKNYFVPFSVIFKKEWEFGKCLPFILVRLAFLDGGL